MFYIRVKEDKNEQAEKFTIRLSDNICLTDPIIQFLLQKVQYMGHNIELLVSLDRIADIWRMDNEYNGLWTMTDIFTSFFYIVNLYIIICCIADIKVSLNIELQNKLLLEMSKYSQSVEETDTALQVDERLQKYDVDIEKNIIQQLSTLHNPFLMKVMEDYMPCELYKNDMVDTVHNTHNSKRKLDQIHNLYKEYVNLQKIINLFPIIYTLEITYIFFRLQKIKYILPMQNILKNTLSEILILRYNSASKLVKNIMIEEYKLQIHLKLLRFVYMMEAGHVLNKFYQILFYEVKRER